MPDGRQFQYSIVTPEKVEAEGKADFLALPGLDGEFGVLYNRAPLLVRLSPGLVRVRSEGHEKWYFVAGGFAQVVANQVTVLTPRSASRKDVHSGDTDAIRTKARLMAAPDAARQRKVLDAYAEIRAIERMTARADV